jgi:RNA polymerase sigma-70 factor (ECF subfamily)
MTIWRPDGGLDELYRREYRAVVALAYGLSGSRGAAEELAQDAFLEAHRAWDRIGGYDDPGAWVRRVVVNRSVSRVRRRVAEARALTRIGARRELPAELPDGADEFWRAVRRLPGRQAQVIALHYLEDRPIAEIADVLGISPDTVKVHLHRGRRALAESLGTHAHEEDDQ